jgi:uncharacterized protein (DUF1800 family)
MGVVGQPFDGWRLDSARLQRLLPRRVTRRHVIGGAVAAGTAVTAIRLLGLDRRLTSAATARTKAKTVAAAAPGAVAWTSPLTAETARITHLLRRATFGAGPDELEAAFKLGYGRVVDKLIETAPAEPPAVPGNMGNGINLDVLKKWWVDQMLATPTPFAERMTLFWHNHFTSDSTKVGTNQPYLYWQNLTWRRMALTNFGSMLMNVTIDPAMMVYLDLGTSTGRSPNENYSRELMELFTLGAGNFNEDDVRNGAKALAGWRLPTAADKSQVGVFDRRRAYTGAPVTYLGKAGVADAKGVIAAIQAHPALAPNIVTKVLHHFVSPSPDQRYVDRLTDEFRSSNYDMKTLMRSVFLSPEFTTDTSYRALVKSPIEFAVSALKALNAPQLSRSVLDFDQNMGQILFDPPDVGGWPNNDGWVSSNTVIARVNFVTAILGKLRALPPAGDAHQQLLDGIVGQGTAKLISQTTDDRNRWMVVLMSPEFNLK